MAQIPDKRQLGPLAQLASRPMARAPQSFAGEALSRAGDTLQGVGGDTMAFAVSRAQEANQEQDKAERYQGTIDLAKFEEDEQQAANDAILGAAPGAGGLADGYGKTFDQRAEEFRQKIPERLRPQFEDSIIRIKGATAGKVRNFETAERTRFEGVKADDAVDREVRTAATNPNDPAALSAARDRAKAFIEQNPYMTQIDKDQRLHGLDDKFAVGVANSVNSDPKANAAIFSAPTGSSNGIPPEGAALLNVISGTESPRYDVLNGGEKITSFADHPRRIGAGGTTTAAGRYQFVKGTWDRAAAAVGAKDFTPANQDKAAWWLAQADYKSNTGRDLLSDLRSKDPIVQAGVRRGLSSTWEGLKSLDDGKFVSRLSGSSTVIPTAGTSPDMTTSEPTFQQAQAYWLQQMPNASRDTVQKLAEQSINARNGFIRQEAAARTALAGKTVDDFQLRIATSDPTLTQQDILNSPDIDKGQQASLITSLNSARKEQMAATAAVQLFSSGDATLNPFDNDVQKAADLAYTTMVKAQPEQAQAVADQIVRRGVIPKPVSNQIRNEVYSANPEQLAPALAQASRLKTMAPSAFDTSFTEDAVKKDVTSFDHLVNDRGFSAEQAAQRIIERRQPEFARNAEVRGTEADKLAKKFTAASVAGEFDPPGPFNAPGAGADVTTQNALLADYRDAFKEQFQRTGDEAEAKALATASLKNVWGISTVSGSAQLMQYPPEKFLPPINGGHDYIREDAAETVRQFTGDADDAEPEGRAVPQATAPVPADQLRPFSDQEYRQNADGSFSTEVTTTIQDADGKWMNVPSLWNSDKGWVDLGDNEDAIGDVAGAYEKKAGKPFPRFDTLDAAEKAASERSHAGGTQNGALAGSDGKAAKPLDGQIILKPFIDENTGRNLTAEDVRAGRSPRYRVIYSHKVDGQTIIDTVPSTWAVTPDVVEAARNKPIADAQAGRDAAIAVRNAASGRVPSRAVPLPAAPGPTTPVERRISDQPAPVRTTNLPFGSEATTSVVPSRSAQPKGSKNTAAPTPRRIIQQQPAQETSIPSRANQPRRR